MMLVNYAFGDHNVSDPFFISPFAIYMVIIKNYGISILHGQTNQIHDNYYQISVLNSTSNDEQLVNCLGLCKSSAKFTDISLLKRLILITKLITNNES